MSDTSKIEWTEATWNPSTGCTKVSAGCKNCYAKREWARLSANPKTVYFGRKFEDVRCHPERLDYPLHLRKPRMIFVDSMSDLFHEDVPDGFIMRVWMTMADCQRHRFQILTKRAARMLAWVKKWDDLTGEDFAYFKNARGPAAVRAAHPSGRGQLFADMLETMGKPPAGCAFPTFDWARGPMRWPTAFPNIWLGISAEDQATFDERVAHLRATPAAVRFVSLEPLLGPIDCGFHQSRITNHESQPFRWLIAGGESGPKARPSNPDWFRSLRDQCAAAGVPFFFKQWGEWASPYHAQIDPSLAEGKLYIHVTPMCRLDGTNDSAPNYQLSRVGKKAAGRLLDGREHSEYPA